MADPQTCGSVGSYAKLLVEDSDIVGDYDPATFDSNSERYEFLRETITYSDVLLGGNGITGGIDPIAAHLRSGTRIVHGQIFMEVGPVELSAWLPRIFGNTDTPPTFTTAETFDLTPFDLFIRRDQGDSLYRHCAVNSAAFRCRASIEGEEQVMQMMLDIIGYQEHGAETWPVTEPALPSSNELYWLLGDGKLSLDVDGDATLQADEEYYFDAFNLLIDNNLVPQTRNFLRVTCLQSRGRKIRLQVSTPYMSSTHTDLYISRFDGKGQLNFLGTKNLSGTSESTYTTTIDFPRLVQTRRTPNVSGPGEIPLSLDLEAFRTSSAEPITVTNSTS